MDREHAEAIAGLLAGKGILAEAAEWGDGGWGVELPTPFVTPDGRTAIGLWAGSGDDGLLAVQYGDYGHGSYADEWERPGCRVAVGDAEVAAAWIHGRMAAHEAGAFIPEPFESGLKAAYADILEG